MLCEQTVHTAIGRQRRRVIIRGHSDRLLSMSLIYWKLVIANVKDQRQLMQRNSQCWY